MKRIRVLQKLLLAGSLLSLSALFVGCPDNVYYGGTIGYSGWYNVYGQQCGSLRAGCNYWSDGLKIVDYEDPYYEGDYYWESYYDYYYGVFVWESPSGLKYDEYGRCLNNKNAPSLSKDLVTVVSNEEEALIQKSAKVFAETNGIDKAVALNVARTYNGWAKLGFLRGTKGRTEQDMSEFTKKLYGVDYKKLKSALVAASVGQDQELLNQTIKEVATNWKTSPGKMRKILKNFHGDQLDKAGIELE